MSNPVKVGLLGVAHSHARSYFRELSSLEEAEVVGVADDDASAAAAFVSGTGVRGYEDVSALLASDAELVVICSENARHGEHVRAVAAAGKHALCEKPLGISMEDMRSMIAVCKERGVGLMTAFPCRYLPPVIEAKRAVDRGDIGKLLTVKGTNRGKMPGGWFVDPARSGGGAVIDHTVHVMDLMRWISGVNPVGVYAEIGTLFHSDLSVEDTGILHVTFEDGIETVLDTSWSRGKSFPYWGDVTLEIVGSKGSISVDAFAQRNEWFLDEPSRTVWNYWGERMDRWMLKDCLAAVRDGNGMPITGEDGLQATAIALAAYDSARLERKVSVQGVR
ncbi:Gfo/Idh/MocA family oxidoreductase [Paenibacillus sp. TRM 82003]|nr:Gfo/Idh/MocA family oxidoreductase [Paenibacillus sp. TRM 82003]